MPGSYRGKRIIRGGGRSVLLLVLVPLALAAAAAVLFRGTFQTPGGSPPQPPNVPVSAAGSASSSIPASDQSQQPDRSDPPASGGKPEVLYDFSQPAPERAAVDNSYFDDAAFIGDSRTDGFMIYSGVGTGKNLTSNGLSIFKLAEKKALTIDGKKYTLLEALALEEYQKVYLSLGVNELGYYDDNGFFASYCTAIDEIRRLQPNAVIYIQGLIPLNEGQIEEHNGNRYNLTNDHLRVFNDLMRQAAEEKQVVFLDLYSEFVNENNELPEEASRDGVHLSKEYCQRWLAYLKTHTVDFDTLYPDGPPAVETQGTANADGSGQG